MKNQQSLRLDPTKCSEIVAHYMGRFYDDKKQCLRKWSVTAADGRHYCKQHDPDAVKRRVEKREDHYNYEQATRAMGWCGCALYKALTRVLNGDSNATRYAKKALRCAKPYYDLTTKGKRK